MNQKKILVIGSTCVDVILNIHHLPVTGEDIHPLDQTMSIGGCAYNVAHTISQFHADMTFITPVGTGVYGDYIRQSLDTSGFASPVHVNSRENGCCYCLVEQGGERTFMSLHGAEYTFIEDWMDNVNSSEYGMIYICGLEIEEPTGGALVHYLETLKGPEIFFAPGPRAVLISEDRWNRIIKLQPVLHINEPEAAQLGHCSSYEDAAAFLCSKTHNTVIITLGGQGAYCLEKSGISYLIPPVPTGVTDTIGAGDSHIGTILASLSLGSTMKEAITRANAVSSAVVSVKGASLPENHPLFHIGSL